VKSSVAVQGLARFLIGGTLVSLFALIGDVIRPKGFAGLLAAAPSMPLVSLALAIHEQGRSYAAVEARSMMVGSIAFVIYALACVYFLGVQHRQTIATTLAVLALWFIAAFGLWAMFLQ
jgi:uncharacterized membrane protein (GlpM family)